MTEQETQQEQGVSPAELQQLAQEIHESDFSEEEIEEGIADLNFSASDERELRRLVRKLERNEYLNPYQIDRFKQTIAVVLLTALETLGEELVPGMGGMGEVVTVLYAAYFGGMAEAWDEGYDTRGLVSKEGLKSIVKGTLESAILPLAVITTVDNLGAIDNALGISQGVSALAETVGNAVSSAVEEHWKTAAAGTTAAAGFTGAVVGAALGLKKAVEKTREGLGWAADKITLKALETQIYLQERELVFPLTAPEFAMDRIDGQEDEKPHYHVDIKLPRTRSIVQKRRSPEGV